MNSRLIQGAGNYKPKPAIEVPSKGDLQLGYYGRIPSTEFINAYDLYAALFLTNAGSWNVPTSEWLKFALNGKILLIPRACLTNGVSWNLLQSQSLLGGRTVTVRGKQYAVRMMTDSEWSALIPRVSAGASGGTGQWDTYQFPEISQSSLGITDRVGTLTSTISENKAVVRAMATNVQFSSLAQRDIYSNAMGWRPVLELIA